MVERPPLGIVMEARGICVERLGQILCGAIVLRKPGITGCFMKCSFFVARHPSFFSVIPHQLHLILQADSFPLTFPTCRPNSSQCGGHPTHSGM